MDKIFQIKLQKLKEDRKKKSKEEFDYSDFTDPISGSDNGAYNDYMANSQPNPKHKNIVVWNRAGKPGSD
jgi:hypothetical protein